MKLFTKDQLKRLFDNYGQDDAPPVVKLFTPFHRCTWLLSELDPGDPDLAFGLCDLGHGCPELGYVRISEITAATLIERDRYFTPKLSMSAYADEARAEGGIRV